MAVTASRLRQNIYRLLDQVLETGVLLEVERKGKVLRIAPVEPGGKLGNLVRREDFLRCDPEDLVHLDWSEKWKP